MKMRSTLLLTLPCLMGIILGCAKVYHVATEESNSYRINEGVSDARPDSEVELLISPYRDDLYCEMSQVISLASKALEKGDRNASESTLGNWVADAVLAQAKLLTRRPLAFGICNSGGLRVASLPAGPITKGQMFELMPFDNYLVTMDLPGHAVQMLFDAMAAKGGWPISAGVQYKIKDGVAHNITIDSQPFDKTKNYEIVLSDYLAEGGGDLDFLKEYPYQNLGVYYRDALIEQALMLQGISQSLDAQIEGRVINLDR